MKSGFFFTSHLEKELSVVSFLSASLKPTCLSYIFSASIQPAEMVRCEPFEEKFDTPFGRSTLLQYGLSTPVTDVQAQPLQGVSHVIYLIPGNPGAIFTYNDFMRNLYETHRIPVFGSNHSGGSRDSTSSYTGDNTCEEKVYEREHFILKYIPQETKIIMIGQSFGAYVALNLMRNEAIEQRTSHVFLLTPALELLKDSSGAKFMKYFFFPLRFVLLHPLILLLSLVPQAVYEKILPSAMGYNKTIASLSSVQAVENTIRLAYDEFKQIDQRDDTLFKCIRYKSTLVYSGRDEWVPLKCYEDIKATYEDCDAHLLQTISHAFFIFEKERNLVLDIVDRRINSILGRING